MRTQTTTTATDTAKIFLTDYASYNNGTQFEFGHWVDLSDFSDADELMEYISDHLAEADKISPFPSHDRLPILKDSRTFFILKAWGKKSSKNFLNT